MIRVKRICITVIAFSLTFLSLIPFSAQQTSAREGLLSFVPVLQVNVDTSKLGTIQPGGEAVSVPVKITYYLQVPDVLTIIPIWWLKHLIIYGRCIVPPLKVHLSIVNKPDWMDASISTPYVYISPEANKYVYANTTLSISVYKDAPAQPYTIILRAESDGIGHVAPQTVEAQFPITPGYIPLVTISTSKPIIEAGPMTTVTFPISINNNANKETVVKLVDIERIPGWAIKPSQYQVVIPQGKSTTLSISVTTPYSFGWVAGQVQTINMKFVVLPSPPPLSYEETPSNTYPYSVAVRSGSAPMIGLIGGIIAIIVMIVIVLLIVIKRKISLPSILKKEK